MFSFIFWISTWMNVWLCYFSRSGRLAHVVNSLIKASLENRACCLVCLFHSVSEVVWSWAKKLARFTLCRDHGFHNHFVVNSVLIQVFGYLFVAGVNHPFYITTVNAKHMKYEPVKAGRVVFEKKTLSPALSRQLGLFLDGFWDEDPLWDLIDIQSGVSGSSPSPLTDQEIRVRNCLSIKQWQWFQIKSVNQVKRQSEF